MVGTRSGVLRRALAVVVQAQARELRARVWDAWCEFMSRRADIVDMVNRMSSKRRLRILGDVFDVWQKYTQVRLIAFRHSMARAANPQYRPARARAGCRCI